MRAFFAAHAKPQTHCVKNTEKQPFHANGSTLWRIVREDRPAWPQPASSSHSPTRLSAGALMPLCTEQLSPLSHALDEFGSKAINLQDLLRLQTPGFQFGCNQVRMFLTDVPQRISHGFADVLARITAQPRQP